MSEEREEIQKRHTLNWLIQGAAQHAGMTFHHLVRDELNAIEPRLLRLYDQYALINLLQYWQLEVCILLGSPKSFWRSALTKRSHPFYGHPSLAKYGGLLAGTSRDRALERCKEKGMTRLPIAFSVQTGFVIQQLKKLEAPHRQRLTELAKVTASKVWGIPLERLHEELSNEIVLGEGMLPARNSRGAFFRGCIVGYGGVERWGNQLKVVGKGTNWQLLSKELVKGTAELISLHGLNQLSDERYRRVLEVTDHLDLEPWMLQSGGELWRRLLAVMPEGLAVAKAMMHLAKLPTEDLQAVIANIVEEPGKAADRFLKFKHHQ